MGSAGRWRADIATGPVSSGVHAEVAHHGDSTGAMLPAIAADHLADHTTVGMTGGGPVDACPDCADHQMAFGSCLLALTLLVLSWSLIPPRLRHLPPFLLPRLAPTMIGPAVVRLVPPLSLAELSVRRT
jgi:hypothetical protein